MSRLISIVLVILAVVSLSLADTSLPAVARESDSMKMDRATDRLGHANQQKLRNGKISAMFDGFYSGEVNAFFA